MIKVKVVKPLGSSEQEFKTQGACMKFLKKIAKEHLGVFNLKVIIELCNSESTKKN